MQIMGEDREGEGGDKGATMLASRALHEMESPTAETGAATAAEESDQGRNLEQVKKRRMAELPGSLGVVAELPIPQEGGQKFNEVD
ncbi:hypothetical protein BJY04DRAFT_195942 [Aspergillus karnatakaensis]|uniref:uncharacterized protein n=1 Tax=Aspergillus karnatakaensis TaxID=1810916 RepID=UPI003CCE1182